MMTSVIMSIFLKNVKNGYNMFFSKINLATARKRFSRSFFSF